MTEHQKETAFLRQCLRYVAPGEGGELEERIHQIQRDENSVRRAAWLLVKLSPLTLVGVGYALILGRRPFDLGSSVLVQSLFYAVWVASVISLLYFVSLGIFYRRKLNQRREECRQLIARLMAFRLGNPVHPPLPPRNSHAEHAATSADQPARDAPKSNDNGHPEKTKAVTPN